ncbi:hypothetical protein MASR2M78_35730 [Treponema sp.]
MIGIIGNHNGTFPLLLSVLFLAVIGASASYYIPSSAKYLPRSIKSIPFSLLIWLALLIFLMQTVFYIEQSIKNIEGSGILTSNFVPDWIIRLLVAVFVLFVGRSWNMIILLYLSFSILMLAMVLKLVGGHFLGGILINVNFALSDIAVALILIDLSSAHIGTIDGFLT